MVREIKKNTNIVAVFLVGEMIYYDDLNMLNQDYRYRIANSQSEVLAFDKITKNQEDCDYALEHEMVKKCSKGRKFIQQDKINFQQ